MEHKSNTSLEIVCQHGIINFSTPKIMGILNVTPDSFFDGGKFDGITNAIEQALKMIQDGADIIDIGGQSTKPGAQLLTANDEWQRIETVLKAIRNFNKNIIISIDTFYSEVAKKSIEAGADIINDISAGTMDENMFDTIAALKVPYIIMHIQGSPSDMQINPNYNNVSEEVYQFLEKKIFDSNQKGIDQLIVDPGFGFGKTLEHNYDLLKNLAILKNLNQTILVGISRKSMVYKLLNTNPENALNGTTALNLFALMQGANILRVHDVREAKEVVEIWKKLGG